MRTRERVELLAPAGSMQSFFAALEYGADAVFCGLKHFSARAKAKNFTLEELAQLVGYAHRLDKKIYVALNTLIKEGELPELITVLGELERLEIDGLILQDMGLYQLARFHFPGIPLHGSTQMVVHNLAGVQVLERLGFERVVLARELSLTEIRYIAENTSLEIEHFIHGALCYSLSGHCLFSSYIDGRSGNRGRCIQPCRRRYQYGKESGFYFSTSDFSALQLIPDLVQAGVVSLKIEGRMKSPEYVAAVVGAYRTVLDAGRGMEQDAMVRAKEQLQSAMGRKSSPGFLDGSGGVGIVLPQRKGGIGEIIGKVERVRGGTIHFRTSAGVHVGDRLRIQPGDDRAGQGFTVRTLFIGARAVKRGEKGKTLTIPLPLKARVQIGDLVFKLATGKSFTLSEEACRRRLKGAPVPCKGLLLAIECIQDPPCISLHAQVAGLEMVRLYEVEMIVATHSPLSEKTLHKVFSHTGYPDLGLAGLTVGDLPEVVIKPSRLKAIRRDFYAELAGEVQQVQREGAAERETKALGTLDPPPALDGGPKEERLFIVSDSLADVSQLGEACDLQFIFPLDSSFVDAVARLAIKDSVRRRIFWDLPSLLFDQEHAPLETLLVEVLESGYTAFRLNNIGHFGLFGSHQGLDLVAGPWLYFLNSQAGVAMKGLGCKRYSLSLEDDRDNMKALLGTSPKEDLLVTVYAPLDLFTSRIDGPLPEKDCRVHNDQGEQFSLHRHGAITVTQAARPFSILASITELRKMGSCNFVIDLRGIGIGSAAGQDILAAFYGEKPLSGTMALNYLRGLA